MKKIGILSDTHGLLRPEVKTILRECDAILHAGDIDSQNILDELMELAPTYAVRGNADKAWAHALPTLLALELFGKHFCLVHNRRDLTEIPDLAEYIVYGHSHRYDEHTDGQRIWLNPGSCGKRRFSLPITMMVMEVSDDGGASVRRVDLAGETAPSAPSDSDDLAKLVKTVMREVDRGTPVSRIAQKYRISPDLAEQICRMYTTHPGVDVDGIINRISGT